MEKADGTACLEWCTVRFTCKAFRTWGEAQMTILAGYDPGDATGFCLSYYDAITPLRHISHTIIKGGLPGVIEHWYANNIANEADEVVCESFRLDGRTQNPDTIPLEIQGALTALCWEMPFALQANTYKSHVTDAKLKELELWWPGEGHDRDALRHSLAYLKTRGHYPTLRWAFPPQL